MYLHLASNLLQCDYSLQSCFGPLPLQKKVLFHVHAEFTCGFPSLWFRLLVNVQVRVIAQDGLYDGSVADHLLADGDLLGEQAVLLQQHLHVHSEEVIAQLVSEPHKVAHHVAALVDEQSGQGAVPEQLAGADARAAHAAELDASVLLSQAQQAAPHGLAARHVGLIDVDDDYCVPVLLVKRVQKVLAVVQLIDLCEAFDAVVVPLHLLHALQAVLLEEGFVVVVVVIFVLDCQLHKLKE